MSSPRIKKLTEELAIRIAAGEVVERPSSALKELLENSIDAKAEKIIVELKDGGIKQIKVVDNGLGIVKDDLILALDRNATSKITQEEDLYLINTLGFRGEGLASIASVSNLNLSSKTVDDTYGYQIQCDFGKIGEVKPCAINNGTIVEVNGIFHNIPARKKFLKSDTTEYTHCKGVFERISLSYPQISFELKNNNKVIYQLPSQPLLERIAKLFGDDYNKHYFEILETLENGLNLSGYVYHPSYLPGNKLVQYFYLNGRYIKDRIIQNAIKQGFSGVLHHEHQPQYILFLDIEPLQVDVNVHPTKSEVRFKDSGQIHAFISRSLKKALAIDVLNNNSPLALDVSVATITDTSTFNSSQLETPKVKNNDIETYNSFNKVNPSLFGKSSFNNNTWSQSRDNTKIIKQWLPEVNDSLLMKAIDGVKTKPVELFTENGALSEEINVTYPKLGFAIAQLLGIYILSQTKDGLIIVDMHAAHERILLEKLKTQLDSNQVIIQELLVPVIVNISEELQEVTLKHKNDLAKLGFEIDLFGEQQIIIRSTPLLLGKSSIEKLMLSLLNELAKYGNSNVIAEHQEEILSTISCHSAVRANHELNVAEMNALLREMETTQRANYCNHGRPTWFKLTLNELDAMFMRGK